MIGIECSGSLAETTSKLMIALVATGETHSGNRARFVAHRHSAKLPSNRLIRLNLTRLGAEGKQTPVVEPTKAIAASALSATLLAGENSMPSGGAN